MDLENIAAEELNAIASEIQQIYIRTREENPALFQRPLDGKQDQAVTKLSIAYERATLIVSMFPQFATRDVQQNNAALLLSNLKEAISAIGKYISPTNKKVNEKFLHVLSNIYKPLQQIRTKLEQFYKQFIAILPTGNYRSEPRQNTLIEYYLLRIPFFRDEWLTQRGEIDWIQFTQQAHDWIPRQWRNPPPGFRVECLLLMQIGRLQVTAACVLTPKETTLPHISIYDRLTPRVPFSALLEQITWLDMELQAQTKLGTYLISLSPDQFDEVYRFVKTYVTPPSNTAKIATINPDNISKDAVDYLEFSDDIEAIAMQLAYKSLKPPLALGLFGEWGSGKSFFMDKLQQQIQQFSASQLNCYCKEIAHIRFNSWHYADSNLWASLMTRVMEGLHAHGKENKYSLQNIYSKLNTVSVEVELLQSSLEKIDSEKNELRIEKNVLERKIEEDKDKLKRVKLFDLAKAVWNDPEVKKDIDFVKEYIPEEKLNEFRDVERKLWYLSSTVNRVGKIIELASKNLKGRRLIALIIVAIIATIGFCAAHYKWAFHDTAAVIFVRWTSFAGAVAIVYASVEPAIKTIRNVYKKMRSLNQTLNKLKKDQYHQHERTIEDLQKALDRSEEEFRHISARLKKTAAEKTQIETDIQEIRSGHKLHQFIADRMNDERYLNNLGIVSWIRKDFEKLNELFAQHHEAATLSKKDIDQIKKEYHLERIVLYIDDLDRCSSDVVMRVLEAIHLLLAFPLFVVVVGVDERWVTNAVENKMKRNENSELDIAKPIDYLEKIFQIPFQLKSMTDETRKQLIRGRLSAIKTSTRLDNNDEEEMDEEDEEESGEEFSASVDFDTDLITLTHGQKIDASFLENQHTLPENLRLDAPEIDLMTEIAFLAGNTPRRLNRFINSYSIIRVHRELKINKDNPLFTWAATMLNLAFITSMPDLSARWFGALAIAEPDSPLTNVINQFNKDNSEKHKLKHIWKAANIRVGDKIIAQFPVHLLLENAKLISRFSFQQIKAN